MRCSSWNICFLAMILFTQAVVLTNCDVACDSRCLTKSCDADGKCLCATNPSSVGLRAFMGGEFCDQPSHYCNGSTTFWCVDNAANSTCGVAADGSPTCICQLGYAGEHCEMNGTQCGVGYCYNNATCLNGNSCDCPSGWKGNANCSLSSPEDASASGSHIKWWGGLLITGAVVAVVSAIVVFGLKKYRDRMEGVNRFNELKKSQMRGRAESDDDEYDSDPYEDDAAKRSTTTPQGQKVPL